ncbi:nuclear transport factor 2 family protein [Microbacterium sp. RD1]|uniref:nuclear transport factor 2 family protein n=1 Tax=Microbacterium sp. RD1 TaxID=3457313 RepID=UPI003FA5B68B
MSVDELLAKAEIMEVLTKYFRAMDRVDDEIGFEIFHDDATGDYGPDIFQGSGRDLIVWLNDYNRTLVTSHHQMSNVTIHLAGNRATSETYVEANLIRRDDTGYVVRHVHGRYLDRLSTRDGRWAIDHRHYRRDFVWEERQPDVVIGESYIRSREDRSYQDAAWLLG